MPLHVRSTRPVGFGRVVVARLTLLRLGSPGLGATPPRYDVPDDVPDEVPGGADKIRGVSAKSEARMARILGPV